jgi:hypothetical protein
VAWFPRNASEALVDLLRSQCLLSRKLAAERGLKSFIADSGNQLALDDAAGPEKANLLKAGKTEFGTRN